MVTKFKKYIKNIEDFTELEVTEAQAKDDSITLQEIEKIESEIRQIEEKTAEIMELFVSNKIDFSSYQTMLKMSTQRRNDLETRLVLLQSKNENKEIVVTKSDIIENFNENWELLNKEERLQFIQKFIKKIVIHNETIPNSRFKTVTIQELQFNEY